MAQANKKETLERAVGVLSNMVGQPLTLEYPHGTEGICLIPAMDRVYRTPEEMLAQVNFACRAIAMRESNDRIKREKLEQEAMEDLFGRKSGKKDVVKWTSELTCNFCQEDVREMGKTFVDGKTRHGPWALMCEKCHKNEGYPKMGQGYGQRYSSETLEKVEG